jgi:inner membrane protein involved in colicin E2 resistance
MINKLSGNIETSWKKLSKKDSDLAKILKNYKSQSGNCCWYIVLIIALVFLWMFVFSIFKDKGYLW